MGHTSRDERGRERGKDKDKDVNIRSCHKPHVLMRKIKKIVSVENVQALCKMKTLIGILSLLVFFICIAECEGK